MNFLEERILSDCTIMQGDVLKINEAPGGGFAVSIIAK